MDSRDEGGVLRVIEEEVCQNKEIEPKRLLKVGGGGHRRQFREQGVGWIAPQIALMNRSIRSLVAFVHEHVEPNLPKRI